ncbi:MAG: sodium-dependent transporter [Candidatus Omnitrophota bacterium]|nr:MAG: sodium-dependent transporter [Candidatus Omnitrophota bacterium]
MKDPLLVHHRPQWKTHIGFLLAAVGSAIGLGNIWRFPYLCYKNGGGAFLVPYLIALLVVGIPLMILEIGLGHKMRGSAPASFASISKRWEWLGWWQIIFVMFGIVLYYSVIIAWCFNYFAFSFDLAWVQDPGGFFENFLGKTEEITTPFAIGNIQTLILFSLAVIWFLNWIIVFLGVEKGLERANKLFMPLLFFLILILLAWSIRLQGAHQGLQVYLKPNFDKLREPGVWIDAFSQIFFTLSLGFGIIIAYASYLPKKVQVVRDSLVISIVNCAFSFIAGLVVFSVLGYMASELSLPQGEIGNIVKDPISLSFVVFPKTIGMLPAFSRLFGIMFFGCLVIAGLSSSVSILEAFTAGVVDKFHYSRKAVVSVLAISGFLGGVIFTTQAGIIWLDIVDHFLNKYGLVVGGILECILVAWVYRAFKLRQHINHFSLWKLPAFWDYTVKIAIPLVLGTILVNSLIADITKPYGGYPWTAIILIGRDWLLYTLFFAIVVAAHPWKIEPSTRMLSSEA